MPSVGACRWGNTAQNWRRGLAKQLLAGGLAPPNFLLNRCFAQCCRTAARAAAADPCCCWVGQNGSASIRENSSSMETPSRFNRWMMALAYAHEGRGALDASLNA